MADSLTPPQGQFIVFQSSDGKAQVECRFEADTLWLNLNQISTLFDRDKSVISKHLKNIYAEGELEQNSTVANYATVQIEGNRRIKREIDYYHLDVVLAVGYRVRSKQGTQFRQWATRTLQEYLTKGFVMDDERLKNPENSQYFDELLNRIRDIRSSEKIFWRKVCDIYATSIDYDGSSQTSMQFFAQVQNKIHWAAHGHTAAELIFKRVDGDKPHMGLTNYKGQEPTRKEVITAKNYLSEQELETLNRLVNSYLEFAELQARRGKLMKMADWANKLDDFLKLSDFDILTQSPVADYENAQADENGNMSAVKTAEPVAMDVSPYQGNTVYVITSGYEDHVISNEFTLESSDNNTKQVTLTPVDSTVMSKGYDALGSGSTITADLYAGDQNVLVTRNDKTNFQMLIVRDKDLADKMVEFSAQGFKHLEGECGLDEDGDVIWCGEEDDDE
ncbi:MAG: virulence RhuM family protein [Vibrio sp.]